MFREEGLGIGFCDQKFPLVCEWLGDVDNSIGIWRIDEMDIDGNKTVKFGNDNTYFGNVNVNVVGLGIINNQNLKMECFVILNGQLHGKIIKRYFYLIFIEY